MNIALKSEEGAGPILIGWASADITPEGPAVLAGMPTARVSTGVKDPITATALAMESGGGEAVVMISCDLRNASDALRDGVRGLLKQSLPEVASTAIVLNGTHTHTAPPLGYFGIDLDAMGEEAYLAFAVPRIAAAAEKAWKSRQPGGISFGLAHAVVGHNRLISDRAGKSRMYGKTNDPGFSHVEGYEDHSVNLMAVWDGENRLTGVLLNVAVPAQVSASECQISADYWHDTRLELRRRFGSDLFVFPQCSAAGDQSPTVLVDARAEARMERLAGRDRRQTIALRIAEAAASILPILEKSIDRHPVLLRKTEVVRLSHRPITKEDVRRVLAGAEEARGIYEALLEEIRGNPEIRQRPFWYGPVTKAYRTMSQGFGVEKRFQSQETEPGFCVELHVLRIGGMAMAVNPFELYVDFGLQIKARSAAEQTFVVQLAGGGSYVPTARSVAGGAYGAIPTTTKVGPEGGGELVEWTVDGIAALWAGGE